MIYICIPSHNEEQTVGVVLWKVRQVMAELARDYQLLVADDGSTDRTREVLEPYTRVLPLTVLRTGERRGYAAALEMLLREAVERSKYPRRDAVIVLQADFTEDPEHIGALVKRLESGADIVASNAGPDTARPPLLQRLARAIAGRLLARMSWPEEVRDPLTGFCAYRVATIRRALEERDGQRLLACEGTAANAELMRTAAPHARRIEGVEYAPRRERLQRPTRFRALTALTRVRALASGRAAAVLSVEALAPAELVGGVSRRISTAGGPTRSRGNGRRTREDGEQPTRRRRRGGRRRGGSRAQSPAVAESAGSGEAARESGEGGERRRPRRTSRGASGTAENEGGVAPAVQSEAGADGKREGDRKPRRRGRRGGRGRRRKPATDATPQSSTESVPAQENGS